MENLHSVTYFLSKLTIKISFNLLVLFLMNLINCHVALQLKESLIKIAPPFFYRCQGLTGIASRSSSNDLNTWILIIFTKPIRWLLLCHGTLLIKWYVISICCIIRTFHKSITIKIYWCTHAPKVWAEEISKSLN